MRGKSIGPVIPDCGFFGFLFQSAFRNLEAGLSGATEFGIRNVEFGILFFFLTIPHSTSRILVARPTQKMNRALWFLRATPLLSGRATAETQ
ncbi:MAG: hypothetical protein NTX30_19435 [Deltaproteobacteria bacterium]|nr:hypothetical protein [Deltaproteobacteria bacterium]